MRPWGTKKPAGKRSSYFIISPKQKELNKTEPAMAQTTGERWVLTAGITGSPCSSTYLTHLVETATPRRGGKCIYSWPGLSSGTFERGHLAPPWPSQALSQGTCSAERSCPGTEVVWPGNFRGHTAFCLSPSPTSSLYCVLCLCPVQSSEHTG